MTKFRSQAGNVFAFTAGVAGVGCGQILEKNRLILAAIFRPIFSDPPPDASQVVRAPIALIVTTFNLRVASGDWRTLGREPIVAAPQLVFKVSRTEIDNLYLESYDRSRQRPATSEEVRLAPYRSTVSEAMVVQMFLALHGMTPWLAEFDEHTLESIERRSKLLDGPTPN